MTGQPDIVEAKRDLRASITARRRAMSIEQRDRDRDAVARTVLARLAGVGAAGTPWRTVFAYEPLKTEPGSTALLTALAEQATVYVPRLRGDNDLDWTIWGCDRLVGVDAVADADAVLVPAFAVDRTGMRLGRGGGSYDRALPRVRRDAVLAALLFSGEVLERVPTEAWDRPVRSAATPAGWLELGH